MRPADHLAAFVRDALVAGRTREEIRAAVLDAGWTEREAAVALGGWAETAFSPPVPRPRPFVSAREAFLHGLMFVALATVAWHIVALSFALIDYWLPEPGRTGWWASGSVRWSIASLVVVLPLFLVLHMRVVAGGRRDAARRRSLVRKATGYVVLFLASLALLGDLIVAIYTYLNGDLTLRFLLKALVVALVAGLIFLYFRQELEGEDA